VSEEPKSKPGGLAAIGAAAMALMMKGGMACGHLLSGAAKPASHLAGDAVHAAAPLAGEAVNVADDAARAATHFGAEAMHGGAKAAGEGGMGLVEDAGRAAARRSDRFSEDTERILRSAQAYARSEARRRREEEREKARQIPR
jgi:hypothetical protein